MKKKHAAKKGANKKPLRCNICNKSGFLSTYKLKAHLFLHKAVPAQYICGYCSKEFYRSDIYSNHIACHENNKKLHYCDHCDRSFVEKRNLVLHLNIHDGLPRRPEDRYRCVACGADYCEQRLLNYHIRKEHLNLTTKEPAHFKKNLNETWIENVKDTENCVKITKIKENKLTIRKCKITRKKNIKNINEKNEWQMCMASVFANKDNYYSKAICDYCGKQMLKKSIVVHIREKHLKVCRFHCKVCSKSFKRHYQLSAHICGKEGRRKRKGKNSS